MYRIGQFAKLIGVTTNTLKNWDEKGILEPAFKTPYGERRYSEDQLQQVLKNKQQHTIITHGLEAKEHDKAVTPHKDVTTNILDNTSQTHQRTETIDKFQNKQQTKPDLAQSRINIGYARVSTKDQEEEMKKQVELLELFLIKQGKPFKIISDIGSGIDHSKPGLKELIELISTNQVDTVYVLYKDRLIRFGFKLIEECAKHHNTKIEVINQTEEKIDEDEFIEDVVYIINVFSYIFSQKSSSDTDDINRKIAQRLLDGKEMV